MTDTHQDQVALADAYVLLSLGRQQLVGGHVITGLQPRHAA